MQLASRLASVNATQVQTCSCWVQAEIDAALAAGGEGRRVRDVGADQVFGPPIIAKGSSFSGSLEPIGGVESRKHAERDRGIFLPPFPALPFGLSPDLPNPGTKNRGQVRLALRGNPR